MTAYVYYSAEYDCWDILWSRAGHFRGYNYGFHDIGAVTDYVNSAEPGATIHVYAASWVFLKH